MSKKLLYTLVISIISTAIVFLTLVDLYASLNSGPSGPYLYSGVNSYLNNTYMKVDDNYYFLTAKNTLEAIRPVSYKDDLNNFYMYYGYMPNRQKEGKGISLILEYKYSDILKYEEKYNQLNKNYEYYDNLEFRKGKYDICFIKNDEITKFRNTKKVPYTYGAICFNNDELIIRYVGFIDYKTYDDFSNLFECSNCKW